MYYVEKNCHMSNSNVNSLLIKSNPSRCHQVLILAQNQKRKCESAELAALLVAVKITFVIITNITIFPWNVTNSNSNLELHACYHVCFWIMEFICPLTNSCWPVGTTDYGRMISRFQILYDCLKSFYIKNDWLMRNQGLIGKVTKCVLNVLPKIP